jgi:hypothetical protein
MSKSFSLGFALVGALHGGKHGESCSCLIIQAYSRMVSVGIHHPL